MARGPSQRGARGQRTTVWAPETNAKTRGHGCLMRACGSRSAELDSHPGVIHALGGAPGEAIFKAVGMGAREGHDGRGAGLQDRGGRGCRGPEDDGVGLGGQRKEARHRLVDERGAGDEDVVHLGEQVFARGVQEEAGAGYADIRAIVTTSLVASSHGYYVTQHTSGHCATRPLRPDRSAGGRRDQVCTGAHV